MKAPFRLFAAAVINAFLGTGSTAYQASIFNIAERVMQRFMNGSLTDHYGPMSSNSFLMLYGLVVALLPIGGAVGALGTAVVAESLGRKNALMCFNNVFLLCAYGVTALAKPLNALELLALGRFLIGVANGVYSVLFPLFITECAPDNLRGALYTIRLILQPAIVIALGSLGLPELLGNNRLWPFLWTLGSVFALVHLSLTPAFPESPKFLYIARGDRDGAEKAARFYQGERVDLHALFEQYDKEASLANRSVGLPTILKTRYLRMPLLLSVLASLSQNTCGYDSVSNYSTEMFSDIDISIHGSMVYSVLSRLPGLLGALTSVWLVERWGRRPMLLGGLAIVILADVVFFGIGFGAASSLRSYVGIATIFALYYGWYCGPGPVSEFIFGEIAPQGSRAVTASVSMFVEWTSTALYVFFYPPVRAQLANYTFLLMIVPTTLCWLYLFRHLPETKGKPVAQILDRWIKADETPLLHY